ncbi:hypothetical protein VPHK367G1_0048 [Vibrio phage K367 g1]
MNRYVKFNCNTSDFDITDLTSGKVYTVESGTEEITDDAGDVIEIMTPNWGGTCSHLANSAEWIWCDKDGNE